ncbi:hypothetical protein [Rickettsia akari]|uniref:hypothetical protein n=1 Tax=Rickettsia akari TaxID=786 RepID=UPI00004622A4|nr:hypothetical protein [Rickettsia akari]
MQENETGLKYFKDIGLHTIELNKFADNIKEELSDIVTKSKECFRYMGCFFN